MGKTMSNVTSFTNAQKIKEQACDWIIKIEGDNSPSAEDINELKEWIARSPAHEAALVKLAAQWNQMDVLTALAVPNEVVKPNTAKEFAQKVKFVAVSLLVNTYRLFTTKYAVLPALMILLLVFYNDLEESPTPMMKSDVFITSIGEHRKIRLNDGSTMWMNSNSQVSIEFSSTRRTINLLKGEAYFEVKKDQSRPFEVLTSSEILTAIGTAFSVHRHDGSIEVLVTEGIVEVAVIRNTLELIPLSSETQPNQSQKSQHASNSKEVVTSLKAGQSVLIETSSEQPIKSIQLLGSTEIVRQLSWTEGKLVFAGESLQEVVAEVSRFTTLKIEVTDPNIKNIRIGGQFSASETDAFFEVLESGFGINVDRISEDHFVLSAKN